MGRRSACQEPSLGREAASPGPRRGVGSLALGLGPLVGRAPAGAAATVPTVTGPITGGTHGFPQLASSLPLAALGYTEQEYFFEGTAQAYRSATRAHERWRLDGDAGEHRRLPVPDAGAPADAPEKFNGTVVVEWLNVSGGVDAGPSSGRSVEELIRGGYA